MNKSIPHRIVFGLVIGLMILSAGCAPPKPVGPPQIRIDTDPSVATLTVNDRVVGKTPYVSQNPRPGKYLLQFSKDGFEPAEQMLEVNLNSAPELSVKLEKLRGLVLFETAPAGAEVTVNGAFRGKTPLLIPDLTVGVYKVAFRLEGYDLRETDLTVADRIPKVCRMNMKSIFATVQVTSKPDGALVFIDGTQKGQSPCTIEDVLLGDHILRVVKDGFKDHQVQFTLSQTTTYPITVQLEERLAAIDISSNPADAKVTINGDYKGRTPLLITGLRDGKYVVVIERPTFEKIVRDVEIQKTQDQKVDVTLLKATGSLVLSIAPYGSTIVVDGEAKGVSSEKPFAMELQPGSHKIEISKARHRSWSAMIEVEIRKTVSQSVTLQKIWVKDVMLVLKNPKRIREGMLIRQDPDGGVRIETTPGIFEEFKAGEIESKTAINPNQ